jgi:hypothetical protein
MQVPWSSLLLNNTSTIAGIWTRRPGAETLTGSSSLNVHVLIQLVKMFQEADKMSTVRVGTNSRSLRVSSGTVRVSGADNRNSLVADAEDSERGNLH